MQKDIMIGDEKIPVRSTASTTYRYRQAFGSDLIAEFADVKDNNNNAKSVEIGQRLAYVMAMAGKGTDMNTINFEGYINWLDGFDAADLLEAIPEVINMWAESKRTLSETQKKTGQAPVK